MSVNPRPRTTIKGARMRRVGKAATGKSTAIVGDLFGELWSISDIEACRVIASAGSPEREGRP